MTIEFVTQDDPLYILPFFEEFFQHYRRDFTVQRVLVSRAMGKRPRRQLLRELFILYTPVGFLRLCASLILYKCLSILPRTANATRFFSLRQLCKAHRVPYEEVENPNAQHVIDRMRSRCPEVLVSVACPYLLKDTLLSLPPRGCINIHHAPLPRYKGMMPTFWQMLRGEKSVGVTVHYMAATLDEGAVLLQNNMEILPGETLHSLIRRSKRIGAHCMARALKDIASGKHTSIPPDPSKGTYFTFPRPEEMREFHRKGLRAI